MVTVVLPTIMGNPEARGCSLRRKVKLQKTVELEDFAHTDI